MDFEVSAVELRRGAAELTALADAVRADLTTAYHVRAPGRWLNEGWAATAANDRAVTAADPALAAVAARFRALADALRLAARGYEEADERATGRAAGRATGVNAGRADSRPVPA